MFGFGKPKLLPGSIFVVGNSSLFSKRQLTPTEFGREITRLGFRFGVAQFGQYSSAQDISAADRRLLQEVNRNPGIAQLLWANLITGAFLCHAKLVLSAPADVIAEVEAGGLAELRSTMPGMSEQVYENHKDITANFAVAIEREMQHVEENCSLSLLFRYINDFYPELHAGHAAAIPTGLSSFIVGLGSRFVAFSQRDFQLSLQRG
jgi:hypothetical protein